jgi:hypothetical protein
MTITLYMPDGVEINARQERQAKAALYGGGSGRPLGGRSGFRVDTPDDLLTVTATTWTLKPFAAMIDPGATAHQGMYGAASDANKAGTVDAADATYARKDILYIQINDSSAGDGTAGTPAANVLYKAGTPSATPEAPKLTDPGMGRSFLIGTIDVPAAGAGAPMVKLNKTRFVAAGAPLPVYSQDERDALDKYDSLAVIRMDMPGRPTETWDGAGWRPSVQVIIPGVAGTPIIQMSEARVTIGAQSVGIIDFPQAFPNALRACTITDSTAAANGIVVKWRSDLSSKTQAKFTAFDNTTGNGIASGTVMYVSYTAGGV